MKEIEFLKTIEAIIGNKYIGDDCAHIEELGILITQDNLVEDVHFSMKYFTPYQLGYKAGMVNISDIAASGGVSKYITVGLSLPKYISSDFIEGFYSGLKEAVDDVEIIGGDITGAEKIMISITVIGTDKGRRIASRSNAKNGQVVVTSGVHGSSAGGLKLLLNNQVSPKKLIDAHILPRAKTKFAQLISENIKEDYAMMDSSDGLADALFKIAQSSKKTLVIDFSKIKYDKELKDIYTKDYKKMILYGGEDYQIIATVPKNLADEFGFDIIGQVEDGKANSPVIIKNYGEKDLILSDLNGSFNHFE